MWLTVPVRNGKTRMIKDVTVNDTYRWRDKHLKALKMNYGRTFFFEELYEKIERVLNSRMDYLYLISMSLIREICKYAGIETKIMFSSEIGFKELKKTDRLVAICNHLNTSTYLSPNRSADYLEVEKFKDAGVDLEWHNYKHPKYNQQWGDFVSRLSVVDLLFNYGKKGVDLI